MSALPATLIPSAGWDGTLSAEHMARLDIELPEPVCFGSYAGEHSAVVIDRVVAWCRCGWHPARHPRFTVAQHLRDWEEES